MKTILLFNETDVENSSPHYILQYLEEVRNCGLVGTIEISIENKNHTYVKIWPVFKQRYIVSVSDLNIFEAIKKALLEFIKYNNQKINFKKLN